MRRKTMIVVVGFEEIERKVMRVRTERRNGRGSGESRRRGKRRGRGGGGSRRIHGGKIRRNERIRNGG